MSDTKSYITPDWAREGYSLLITGSTCRAELYATFSGGRFVPVVDVQGEALSVEETQAVTEWLSPPSMPLAECICDNPRCAACAQQAADTAAGVAEREAAADIQWAQALGPLFEEPLPARKPTGNVKLMPYASRAVATKGAA